MDEQFASSHLYYTYFTRAVLSYANHNVSTVCESSETKSAEFYVNNQIFKKSMKIPKGHSEIANRRRTENTMPTRSNRRRADNTMPKRSNRRRADNTMPKDQIEEGQTTQCQQIK